MRRTPQGNVNVAGVDRNRNGDERVQAGPSVGEPNASLGEASATLKGPHNMREALQARMRLVKMNIKSRKT